MRLFTVILIVLINSTFVYSTTSNNDDDINRTNLQQRLPQAIIIGVKKAGTRALLEFLRLNTNIKAPGPEVHFFDRHYDRGLTWYRRQMPYTLANETTVEKTPSYFVTKAVPQRIFAMNPNTKLIVVVRDPVVRAMSDYAQTASKRSNMADFESMAFNSSTGEVNRRWGAIKLSTYARHVKRWLVYFPLTQMYFVNGEKLIYEPVATVNGVERFLGLTPQVRDEDFEWHTNDGRKFACIHRHDEPTHCLGKTKGRKHPYVTDVNMRRLRQYFKPYNEQFYTLVQQRFYW